MHVAADLVGSKVDELATERPDIHLLSYASYRAAIQEERSSRRKK